MMALAEQAGCTWSGGAAEVLRILWRRLCLLWELRKAQGEEECWESLSEVLEAMDAWHLRELVLGCHPAQLAYAHEMVQATRIRAELEYGRESPDHQALCDLDQQLAQLKLRLAARDGAAPDGDAAEMSGMVSGV